MNVRPPEVWINQVGLYMESGVSETGEEAGVPRLDWILGLAGLHLLFSVFLHFGSSSLGELNDKGKGASSILPLPLRSTQSFLQKAPQQ